jgi:hypothetical protein
MALITVILVTMLCAAMMVVFTAAIVSDQRANGLDRDQTQAYAAAHAGLEKLTSDLSALFRTDFSPNAAQVNAIAGTVNRPTISGFSYTSPGGGSGYTIAFVPDPNAGPNFGNPFPEDPTGSNISSGPYDGFKGIITPYTLTVTARAPVGAEVRLRRTLQTVAIPVFQFGMFSETDLSFHAGETFNFGGRVHTNANLYLAAADGSTLTFSDRLTAFGHVVRTHLPNDLPTTTGYSGTVLIPTFIQTPNIVRAIARTEGSLTGASGLPSAVPTTPFWTTRNTGWKTVSPTTYNSIIRNGGASGAPFTDPDGVLWPPYTKAEAWGTGARRLELPIVADNDGDGVPDAQPIQLIRRPPVAPAVDPASILAQRYFSTAAFRILLSDDIADIQSLPTVLQTSLPLALDGGSVATSFTYMAGAPAPPPAAMRAPLATSPGPGASGAIPANTYRSSLTAPAQPLIGGFIKIEMQRANGTWLDVTPDLLGLGIAGRNLADISNNTSLANRLNDAPAATQCRDPNPDAVIRLQRVRDVPAGAHLEDDTNARIALSCGYTVDGANAVTGVTQNATDYWPNVLYDTREGQVRDGLNGDDLALGGVIHYVELDMNNLRRYILGQIGTLGNQARNDNGFIVYFSDRRNNNDYAGLETGEYGYEDTVNLGNAAGTPVVGNGAAPETNVGLDAGEDLNGNGTLQLYGKLAKPQNIPLGPLLGPCGLPNRGIFPLDCSATAITQLRDADFGGSATLKALVARANKAILFRRALKIVNGGVQTAAAANSCTATLATPCNNIIGPGLAIASENPVYIQGNFNADGANAAREPNVATAILADTVTLLSNGWNDIRSFVSPSDSTARDAASTGYRVAIVTGKTRAFPKPAFGDASFGSDGGAHNFVRLLEDWNNAANPILRYRGSLVSFFYSRQATGSFKCCDGDAYLRGDRDWTFDDDFLLPALLPPGTPMFRDINTLTFRQILRPNQQ